MIQDRRVFQYQGKVLVERVTVVPPFRFQAIFQEEGCFLFIKGAQTSFYSNEERTLVNTDEAVLLRCGTYFVEWLRKSSGEAVHALAIHLYPDLLQKLYQHELPHLIRESVQGKSVRKIIPDDMVRRFVENMEFYFDNPAVVNDDLLELKIKELILLLLQSTMASSVVQLLAQLFSPRAVSLREVVTAHLYHEMSTEELAALCHLSLSSFKREFKRVFQDSPASYLLSERLKKAGELLRCSQLTVNQIAYQTGFSDPAYFSRAFKKHFQVSPSAYRAEALS